MTDDRTYSQATGATPPDPGSTGAAASAGSGEERTGDWRQSGSSQDYSQSAMPGGDDAARARLSFGKLREDAMSAAREKIDQGKEAAADKLSEMAGGLKRYADSADTQLPKGLTGVVKNVSEHASTLADDIRTTDVDTMARNAQQFVLDNRVGFAIGGLLVGFFAARLLKSSTAA